MLWNTKVVILDEPTAALGVAQTAQVLELVRRLADNGLGVVLISHNMNDVFEVSDRIAALYLGRMAAEVKATDVTHAQVVELITAGRSGDIGLRRPRPRPPPSEEREHDHRAEQRGLRLPATAGAPTSTSPAAPTARAWPTPTSPATPARRPERRHRRLVAARARRRGRRAAGVPRSGRPRLIFSLASDRFLSDANLANLVQQAGIRSSSRWGWCSSSCSVRSTCAGTASGVCAGDHGPHPPEEGDLQARWARRRSGSLSLSSSRRRRRALSRLWYAVGIIVVGGVIMAFQIETDKQIVAIFLAIAVGVAIGMLTGLLVARVGIPSFVVTLALFLGWQGVLLQFIGNGAAISTGNFPLVNGIRTATCRRCGAGCCTS